MQTLHERVATMDRIIGDIEASADPSVRARVRELVDILLEVHGEGLDLLLGEIYRRGGKDAVDAAASDELLAHLLVLHGLHPATVEERVWKALAGVRPYLESHGGNVELLDISSAGIVSLRLEGSCHGCPSSAATLKHALEDAILSAAPEITAVRAVEEAAEPAEGDEFIPMSKILWEDCPFPETHPTN